MEAPMLPRIQSPSRVVPIPPSGSSPRFGKGVVEPPPLPSTPAAQPTTQDVLNAIQHLSKMISQLSKNQEALESKLGAMETTVNANYKNIIKSANYGVSWQIGLWNLNNGTPTADPTVNWS
jgi:hypothetical protein